MQPEQPTARKPRLLYVEWDDSSSESGVWKSEHVLRGNKLMRCHTIGWVVHETSEHMTLASSWCKTGQDHRDYSGDMTIPKAAIRRKRRL